MDWIRDIIGFPEQETRSWQPNCVWESTMCAATLGLAGHPVRIAVTHIDAGVDHAQAQAYIDGRWMPLTLQYNERLRRHECVISPDHFQIAPYRYVPLVEWTAEQAPIAGAASDITYGGGSR